MAKLSANGNEVARYRTYTHDEAFNRDVVREYSLRDSGWVLVKVQHGDKTWTPWRRYGKYPSGTAQARSSSFQRVLERKSGRVEVVA
jgi:hypothetical protein